MKKSKTKPQPARRVRPDSDRPETWPVVWRVVAPRAGSYNYDGTFFETQVEAEARKWLKRCRADGYPVRLERIACGPLPVGSRASLQRMRNRGTQNPGATKLPAFAGFWEACS